MLQNLKQWLAHTFDTTTFARDRFVFSELAKLQDGSSLLDAGAGTQPYSLAAQHLVYVSQDFSQVEGFAYGPTDIVGNIWDMNVSDGSFDAVLCTEVLEHVPYPVETIRELSRVLRPGGTLILTAPSHYRRHLDPYYFSAGFSDRWYEVILPDHDLELTAIIPSGDFNSRMKVELYRTIIQHKWASIALLPALIFFYLKRPTPESISAMCDGYFVVAKKS